MSTAFKKMTSFNRFTEQLKSNRSSNIIGDIMVETVMTPRYFLRNCFLINYIYNNRIAMSVSTFLSFFLCMLAYYLRSFRKIVTKNTWLEAPIQGKDYKL